MPVIVVTRLRLRSSDAFDDFFAAAIALLEHAQQSDGNLGVDGLADADDAWWSCTSWRDRASMRAFVDTDPHRSNEVHLDDWCDEATFVDWEQAGAELPDWQSAHQHLIAEGRSAELAHASHANATRAFPAPVELP